MAKYNKNIVENICSLIRADSFTIAEICAKVGIVKDTYYNWLKTKSDFSDAIKKAQEEFDQMILIEAKRSLVKLIKGFERDETKVIYRDDEKGLPKIKEKTVSKKYYPPSLGAIIHLQTNLDPDNWKNRQDNKLSGEVGIKSHLENLSDEELQKIVDGETE